MPSNRVESVAAHFAPASLIDLHADLFGHRPRLPGIDPREHVMYDEALWDARRDAIRAILDSGGVAELLCLGATVVLPAAVGWAAAQARGDDLADELLPLSGPMARMARSPAAMPERASRWTAWSG